MTPKRAHKIIGIIIVVVGVLALVIYMVNEKKESQKNSNQSNENVQNEDTTGSNLDHTGTVWPSLLQPTSQATLQPTIEPTADPTMETTATPITKIDVEATNRVLYHLEDQRDWLLGRIDSVKGRILDDIFLTLDSYLAVESGNYQMSVEEVSYRMVVNQYDQNLENIGYVDLGHKDYIYIDNSTSYITLSIYQYDNRQIDSSNQSILDELKHGLDLSLNKISDDSTPPLKQELGSEIHMESLSNVSNYRDGWYKSWGGEYEYMEGRLCTRNLYRVDHNPYIFNVNDSRISISISEYDEEGNWVKYNETIKNGDEFVKQSSTSYIGVTVRSKKWGVDLRDLFEEGLMLDFASDQYIDKTETVFFRDVDFSNLEQWKSGGYLYETGEYILDNSKLCYRAFCIIGDTEYIIRLPGGNLRMGILELTEGGQVVASKQLQEGQKWTKSEGTDKIAVTIYDNSKTLTKKDYLRLLSQYPNFGLQEYIRYSHNTLMKEITAQQFVDEISVGWNLGNSLDAKSGSRSETKNLEQELKWGNPYVSKDLIDYVANCGFNTIRIPVTWYYNSYEDVDGTLRIRKEWLDRVSEVVDYGLANNLYVILNTHHEQPFLYAGVDEEEMRNVLGNAKELWTEIAKHFKSYDEHLIFEAYNEIDNKENSWNYSDKAARQMNELNQVFVDSIRSTGGNNENRILMIPTLLDGASSSFYSGFQLPRDSAQDKLVVQVHTYSRKFNQDIEQDFMELAEFSSRVNAPIIIGEFGTTNSYPLPEFRAKHASNFIARAARYGIKCIWWDNGSEYGIIDRRDYSNSKMDMIHALLGGIRGIGYQLEDGIVLNNKEQFDYAMPNIRTGEMEASSWGTITSQMNGVGIPIPRKALCSIHLKAIHEADGIWLQRLLFYDANGVLVQEGIELQSKYYIGKIPEQAVYMKVSINSPVDNIAQKDYERLLSIGDLEVVIRCFDIEDLKEVKLN